jgi:hypothetical protein
MEITNGHPWQNSSQNSVFWRGAKCHCQVAEFLLHKCKKLLKLCLEHQKHYAITRKEHFSFLALTSCQDIATVTYPCRSSRSSQISVCAPAKKARTGLSRSVLLLCICFGRKSTACGKGRGEYTGYK